MLDLRCLYICSIFLKHLELTGSPASLCNEMIRSNSYVQEFTLVNNIHPESCCNNREIKMDVCNRMCDQHCVVGTCTSRNWCACDDGRYNCGVPTLDCFTKSMFGERCFCNADNTFDEGCFDVCDNCSMGNCNYLTGSCDCYPGYMGYNCSTACVDGKYGEGCKQTCLCQNESECNITNGLCKCKPGYTGNYCESTCPLGTWGENCSNICECDECRPNDGYCKCQENWNGQTCSDYCPIQLYDASKLECIELPQTSNEFNFTSIYMTFIGIFIITIIIAYTCLRYMSCQNRMDRHSRPVTASDLDRAEDEHELEEHHYETITDGSITPKYNKLWRADELSAKFLDSAYFDGYERPCGTGSLSLPNLYGEYVFLDGSNTHFSWRNE